MLTRPRLLAACCLAATALVTSGCAAGFDAVTQRPYSPGNGGIGDAGDIAVRSVLVVEPTDGPADLLAAIDNHGSADDTLESITVDGVAVQVPSITLVPTTLTSFVQPDPSLSSPSDDVVKNDDGTYVVPLPGLAAKVGDFTTVVFTFEKAGKVTADALVMTPASATQGG